MRGGGNFERRGACINGDGYLGLSAEASDLTATICSANVRSSGTSQHSEHHQAEPAYG